MNDEPPVDPGNWLHYAVVGLERLERIPSLACAALIGLLSVATGLLWHIAVRAVPYPWIAGGVYLAAVLVDWVWLASLPRRGISYGPVKPPLLGLVGLRLVVSLVPLPGYAAGFSVLACCMADVLLQLSISGAMIYATGIEPFRLGVTHIEVKTPKLQVGKRVRLVQISDLHVERITRRERALVSMVNALDADHILFTGDYLSFSYTEDERAIADARQVLGALAARRGAYAVRGTHQVDPNALLPVLFAGLPVRWLRNEHVDVSSDGCRLVLAGASCTRKRAIDVPAVQCALDKVPADAFTVLMYHTPDLVPEARSSGADLYLAGHTHGGQIRLPLYGALVTGTAVGKRYEMGRYDIDGLTLYVSRGIGMEGKGTPRARVLCPPEIVCIDVVGIGQDER